MGNVRIVKRYRRATIKRALKFWTPLFELTAEEVNQALSGARR